MNTFSDDFNRPNGPIGNGWTVQGLNVAILNGYVKPYSWARVGRNLWSDDNRQFARIDSPFNLSGGGCALLSIMCSGQNGDRYEYRPYVAGSRKYVRVARVIGGVTTYIINVEYPIPLDPWVTFGLEYDNGTVRAYINGQVAATVSDNTLEGNTWVQVYSSSGNSTWDNFYCEAGVNLAFDVQPDPLVEMAIPEEIQFIGEGTEWEPGTPGQPIFQVDKGTIDSQSITSATTGVGQYTPPQAEDTATFTDPSTGLTAPLQLSTGFQVNGGSGLSDQAIEYIERSAEAALPDLASILNSNSTAFSWETELTLPSIFGDLHAMMRTTSGAPPGSPPDEGLIQKLWRILNGGEEPDLQDNIFDAAMSAWADATNAYSSITSWRTESAYTAQDILDAIAAAIPTDLQPILDELAAIRTVSNLTLADPVAAAEAVRGTGLPTVHDVLDELDAIRTVNNYSLGSVIANTNSVGSSLASAISGVDTKAQTILGRLLDHVEPEIHAIGGADDVDLTELHDQVNQLWIDIAARFTQVDGEISGVRGADAHDLTQIMHAILALPQSQVSLQPVLDAVSALSAKLTQSTDAILAAIAAIRPSDYPLWPGAGSAELGAPISGSGDLTIPGPLDGLLVNCTAFPREIEAWTNGGRKGLKWAGHITFVSDIGYTEEIQFPGTDRRVVVPKSMLTCASALVHLRAGVQATVTPWYYAP